MDIIAVITPNSKELNTYSSQQPHPFKQGKDGGKPYTDSITDVNFMGTVNCCFIFDVPLVLLSISFFISFSCAN